MEMIKEPNIETLVLKWASQIRIMIADEVDNYNASSGTKADPVTLASGRRSNFKLLEPQEDAHVDADYRQLSRDLTLQINDSKFILYGS